MAKQELKHRQTQLSGANTTGTQVEQIITLDDSVLPSPEELKAYQAIDPNIVSSLIEASNKEQDYRHAIGKEKIRMIRNAEKRDGRMNWWGMCFAFLCIIAMLGVCAYALYLDKPWFAGIVGLGSFAAVASIFVKGSVPPKK